MQSWHPALPERTVQVHSPSPPFSPTQSRVLSSHRRGTRSCQVHCWFLSALLAFWLAFGPACRLLERTVTSLERACALLLLCSSLPWLAVAFPACLGGDPEWYRAHRTGASGTSLDLAVAFLKFHPLCYLHVFVYGMCLARTRQLALAADAARGESGSAPLRRLVAAAASHGASVGLTGLLLLFSLPALRPVGFKLSARLSVLLPLQGLLLFGLCTSHAAPASALPPDPLARLCSRAPDRSLGEVAYAQYVVHMLVIAAWPTPRLGLVDLALFFLLLLPLSYLCARLITRPAAQLWVRLSGPARAAAPFAVAALLCAAAQLDASVRQRPWAAGRGASPPPACPPPGPPPPLPPPVVVLRHGGAVDVALNWSVEGGGSEGGRRLINPSLLWVGGGPNRSRATLVRAARLHGTACSSQRGLWSGEEVTQLTTTWHSDIVLEASEAVGSAEAWREWEVPPWGPSYLTMVSDESIINCGN